IAGLGAAAGPLAGALLAEADWRWIFLINLPIGIVSLVLVPRMIRDVRDPAADRLPDGLGAAVLAVAVSLLVLGLSRAPDWGWDARAIGSLAGAAGLTALFLWRSARHPAPIVGLPVVPARSLAPTVAGPV